MSSNAATALIGQNQQAPQQDADIVKLKNVRLSFPNLFQHEFYQGEDTGKFSATFLIPKTDAAQVKMVTEAIQRAITRKWPTGKAPGKLELTFRDGDNEGYEGYADHYSLKATKPKQQPKILDKDKTPLTEDDAYEKMYAGMFVNASVEFNAGTDGYGKHRVWCNLRGVQRHADGERFTKMTPVTDDEFQDYDDEPSLFD